MNNEFFECKIKYEKTMENGLTKKVIEPYLVDALSFTEAERRICEEMKPFIRRAFEVADIKKAKFAELIDSPKQEDDRWYKCKVVFTIVDEKSGKEKKAAQMILVKACDIKTALNNLETGLQSSVDYVIAAINETPIIDVYPYRAPDNA